MHDLEVRSLISRMRRLSGCEDGWKGRDSKASVSIFRVVHQEGAGSQVVFRTRGERQPASKEGARATAGSRRVLLAAARVSSITRLRAAVYVLSAMQGEAKAASAWRLPPSKFLLPLCRCRLQNNGEGQRTARCSSPRERSDYLEKTFGDEMDCKIGKTGTLLRDAL